MKNFLNLSADDQRQAFEQTGAAMGMASTSVEKDFWVCWTLQQLFSMPELAPHLTFKGGTSLSKAWGLIDRFSEDIDLTIDRDALGFGGVNSPDQAPSNKQQHKRLKALKAACSHQVQTTILPALLVRVDDVLQNTALNKRQWSIVMDVEDPDQQTLLLYYPTHFPILDGRYSKPIVKIEMGARSDPWPAESRNISAIVAEQFPQIFSSPSFNVQALAPERTFWEKAMLLHEETFRPADKPRKARMARHYYDVYRLIEQGVGDNAAANIELFEQVAAHRQIFFEQTWVDYTTLKADSLRLMPIHEAEWRQDYIAMQAEMFRTEPPSFEVILTEIAKFEQKFKGL